MKSDHIYTCKGKQRAVFVSAYGETIAFNVERAPAGTFLEMTDDAADVVRSGKAQWHRVNTLGGLLTGATAIRLSVGESPDGFTRLAIATAKDPMDGVTGSLTRMNAQLDTANRDLRACVALAA
ncbi:hypothetical protein ACSBOB_19960 [Mesorhizobium sp. ASY16-5R]|uniref:hypothetical protein n=1 Tax=Mesorhizobium sp. ASY16-5R TaxID=3445772 RepID=UPI003F9FDCD6